jgi:hypothetical protein
MNTKNFLKKIKKRSKGSFFFVQKKMKSSTKIRDIARALAKAAFSPESPAHEAFSNMWILKDVIDASEPGIEHIMICSGLNRRKYSISTNSWKNGPDLPEYCWRRDTTMLSVNSHETYIIFDTLICDFSKEIISPANSMIKWSVIPCPKRLHAGHGVGVVDEKIFIFGGYDNVYDDLEFDTIDVFSVKEEKWLDSLKMLDAKGDMGIAVIGNKIFVIGGFNYFDKCLSTVEVLDTETNKWSILPSIKTARSKMGITVVDDRFIWIFGGMNGEILDSIEIFDTEKNEWSTSSIKLTSPMYDMKAITIDHKIFIISFERNEVLDIDSMKWSTMPTQEFKRTWDELVTWF